MKGGKWSAFNHRFACALDIQNMTGTTRGEKNPPIAGVGGGGTAVGGTQADKRILSGNYDPVAIDSGCCHDGARFGCFGEPPV